MIFVKHIFHLSQTAAQILEKFGSYMHLNTFVCSNLNATFTKCITMRQHLQDY